MPSLQRSKPLCAAVAAALLLSACGSADYKNNWDTSSARSGDAMMANTAIQELEAWPPAAYRTTVGSGG
ncbi:hypothetical protein [Alloyangia pacifica]|uniref:hypothetical protein n=1 Tax=Alloyangia pacifica TaxID=311180 RepID=UPI001CFD32AD|nr:hypothetical protein [Alloyangia pacifica]